MADFLKKVYAFPFFFSAYAWLIITGFLAYPYFVISRFKEEGVRSFLYMQGKVVQTAIYWASGFTKEIISEAPMPEKPSILVANHPSTYDTFLFFDFNIKNLICVAKGWPFKIPFYGKYIEKAGYINTDNKTASEIIDSVKERLGRGLHVVIFPEGTRQKGTGRFRSLGFAMAIAAETYVVPFAIKGLENMLAPGTYLPKKAFVRYTRLAPVDSKDFRFEAGGLKMARHVKRLIMQNIEEK